MSLSSWDFPSWFASVVASPSGLSASCCVPEVLDAVSVCVVGFFSSFLSFFPFFFFFLDLDFGSSFFASCSFSAFSSFVFSSESLSVSSFVCAGVSPDASEPCSSFSTSVTPSSGLSSTTGLGGDVS